MDLDLFKSELILYLSVPKYCFLFGNASLYITSPKNIELITKSLEHIDVEIFTYLIIKEILQQKEFEQYTFDINVPFIKHDSLVYITNNLEFYNIDNDYIIFNPLIDGSYMLSIKESICNLEEDIYNKLTYTNNKLNLDIAIY